MHEVRRTHGVHADEEICDRTRAQFRRNDAWRALCVCCKHKLLTHFARARMHDDVVGVAERRCDRVAQSERNSYVGGRNVCSVDREPE